MPDRLTKRGFANSYAKERCHESLPVSRKRSGLSRGPKALKDLRQEQ